MSSIPRRCAAPAWSLTPERGFPDGQLLRLTGEFDVANSVRLETELAERIGVSSDVILDLRDVSLFSVSATHVLTRLADQLTMVGQRLLLVVEDGPVRRVLEAVHAVDVLETCATVAAAARTLRESRSDRWSEPARLRAQVDALRDKLRTRPLVARMLGTFQERYQLADLGTANDLLRVSSQRHNLKVRALAAAFLAASPPDTSGQPLWFPGRTRPPAPSLTFAERPPTDRKALFDSLLEVALAHGGTDMADIQLLDPALCRMGVERHRGLPTELLEFLEHHGCAAAAFREHGAVTVAVATDPVYPEPARASLLAAGVRSVRSVPLLTPGGQCVGTVSTHHRAVVPPAWPDAGLLRGLAIEAGGWLDWHHRTTTLDALEHLHTQAREAGDPGRQRSRPHHAPTDVLPAAARRAPGTT
jgi:anti-anti-sigma factor